MPTQHSPHKKKTEDKGTHTYQDAHDQHGSSRMKTIQRLEQ